MTTLSAKQEAQPRQLRLETTLTALTEFVTATAAGDKFSERPMAKGMFKKFAVPFLLKHAKLTYYSRQTCQRAGCNAKPSLTSGSFLVNPRWLV